MKNIITVGKRVKSHYQAQWKGVVTNVEKTGKDHYIANVDVDTDRNGNPLRKIQKHTLDVSWLTLI
jgi:hypothetical protein